MALVYKQPEPDFSPGTSEITNYKDKKKMIIIIVLGVMLLLGLVILLFFRPQPSSPQATQNPRSGTITASEVRENQILIETKDIFKHLDQNSSTDLKQVVTTEADSKLTSAIQDDESILELNNTLNIDWPTCRIQEKDVYETRVIIKGNEETTRLAVQSICVTKKNPTNNVVNMYFDYQENEKWMLQDITTKAI